MGKVVAGAVLAAAALVALLAGAEALAGVVVFVAGAALVDASLLFSQAGARPVLVVALLPGVVLPVVVALDPAAGWSRVPTGFAASLLLGFFLLLVFGRRRGVVGGLGATFAVSLVVGLGASGLLLLRDLPDGFRWVLALAVLVLAADLAGPLLALARRRGHPPAEIEDTAERMLAVPLDAVLPGLVAVTAAAVALVTFLQPPLTWLTAGLLATVALIAALGGSYLQRALMVEAQLPVGDGALAVGRGGLFGLVDAVLLAAPAAYVIARSAVL